MVRHIGEKKHYVMKVIKMRGIPKAERCVFEGCLDVNCINMVGPDSYQLAFRTLDVVSSA